MISVDTKATFRRDAGAWLRRRARIADSSEVKCEMTGILDLIARDAMPSMRPRN